MTVFADLSAVLQTFIVVMFFLLSLFQVGYLQLLARRRRYAVFAENLCIFAAIFLCMVLSAEVSIGGTGLFCRLPVILAAVLWFVPALYTAYFFRREWEEEKQRLSARSIKESFDNLPAGICFFNSDGLLVLCNSQMLRLSFELSGRDLQTISELRSALAAPQNALYLPGSGEGSRSDGHRQYRFSDGSVWDFSEAEVTADGREFREFVATDITRLFDLQADLSRRNQELESMIAQVQRVSANQQEITRQQEILTAKMRVHNKMGNCLLAARQYIMQGMPQERKQDMLDLWTDSLEDLGEEISAQDEKTALEEIIRIAESIGVEVSFRGEMPADDAEAGILETALRETVTNALHHAGATRLDMTVKNENGTVTAVFTNNGRTPEGEIREGGGLGSLRERVERSGGKLEIQSTPEFVLKVTLP